MCEKTNSTYLDCPVSDFDLKEGSEFYVSVHNPSSLKLNVAQISVPHGKFMVQEFIEGEYQQVVADVMCYKDYNAKGEEMENCQMFIKSSIEARDINLYKLTSIESANSEVP
jgi:hypothetical protein